MKIPIAWMPPAKMQRIIMHWTAGQHTPSDLDLSHYHILVDGRGEVVRGKPSIDLNEAPTRRGYAAHTLNCNSGSIGVSMCAMAMAVEKPFDAGKQPITFVQFQGFCDAVAELALRYGIAVTDKTILSHAEVQANLKIQQRGKWDIARLPFNPDLVGAKVCGDFIRQEVIVRLKNRSVPPAERVDPAGKPLKSGTVTASVLNIRALPSTSAPIIAKVARGGVVEIHGTQDKWANIQTSFGARGWASLEFIKI